MTPCNVLHFRAQSRFSLQGKHRCEMVSSSSPTTIALPVPSASPSIASALDAAATTANPAASLTPQDAACLDTRYWFYFLASSLVVFLFGLVTILVVRLVHNIVSIWRLVSRDADGVGDADGRSDGAGRNSVFQVPRLNSDGGGVGGGDSGISSDVPARKSVAGYLQLVVNFYNRLKCNCEKFISGQTLAGKFIVSVICAVRFLYY